MYISGVYGFADSAGYLRDQNGKMKFSKSVLITGAGSVLGHYLASPLFLVKTQLQSQAAASIAVGHQHRLTGSVQALKDIYKANGVKSFAFIACPKADKTFLD